MEMIYNLRNGIYWLRVEADGYKTYRRQFDMRLAGDRFHADVQLLPLGNSGTAYGAVPSLTDQMAPKDAQKLYKKGEQALSRQQMARAKPYLEKAITLFPCYARARTGLALVHLNTEDFPVAESHLQKAIECDSGYVPAYGLLASLLNRGRRYEESEKVLKEGLRKAPGDGWLHEQLGTAYYMEGRNGKAEEELKLALSFNPKDPGECHARLAAVYLRSRSYQQAHEEMRAYLQIEPEGRFAEKLRKIMRQLEADGQARVAEPQAAPAANSNP